MSFALDLQARQTTGLPLPVHAAEMLEHWLLTEALLGDEAGRTSGSVVNFREVDGSWNSAYPEICGYYLQFCVEAAPANDDGPHLKAARRVASWLAQAGAEGERGCDDPGGGDPGGDAARDAIRRQGSRAEQVSQRPHG